MAVAETHLQHLGSNPTMSNITNLATDGRHADSFAKISVGILSDRQPAASAVLWILLAASSGLSRGAGDARSSE
jgi:hypothetical protein